MSRRNDKRASLALGAAVVLLAASPVASAQAVSKHTDAVPGGKPALAERAALLLRHPDRVPVEQRQIAARATLSSLADFGRDSPSMLAGVLALLVCAGSGLVLAPESAPNARRRI